MISRVVSIAALVILASAVFFAAFLAHAESEFRVGTPEALARAVELRPGNTRYLALRALQLDYDGADSVALLERIASLNPVSSSPRIRLGLAAELRGDLVTAEHWLLSAARVDRQFEPSWTLANFYFRQERASDFWTWIRRALEVSYGDRTPAFELCWRMAREPREVLERALPERPEVATAYLHYLFERHNATSDNNAIDDNAIEEASLRLAPSAAKYDAAVVYAACDWLIGREKAVASRRLWVLLGNPDPTGITNGDFREPARGRGFDWRWSGEPGVVHLPLDGGGHRVVLSGKEAESSNLLRQIVYLEPAKHYTLRWKSRTTGIATPTGLSWNVAAATSVIESSGDWHEGTITFTAKSVLTPVEFAYRRPQGLPRAEGSADITSVSIAAVPASALAEGSTSLAK